MSDPMAFSSLSEVVNILVSCVWLGSQHSDVYDVYEITLGGRIILLYSSHDHVRRRVKRQK